ncbi:MAG: uracil-DNA glycosylase [Myxococcota bacterium]
MSGGRESPDLDAELRATLGAARAWLGEWLEEGVETFVRAPREDARERGSASPGSTAQGDLLARVPAGPREPLEAIHARLGDCQRCPLAEGRKTIVFGDGKPDADILFIGEGPGAEEDKRGIPFVGRAGELLTRMIERGMGIPRADVYICNIVKCRPPGNREPTPQEIGACRPFLDAQIDSVAPRVIVTLGRPATGVLLGRDVAITRMRGSWQEYRGIPVMPTFHPAFILRQYTEQNRRLVWEDLKAALALSRGGERGP